MTRDRASLHRTDSMPQAQMKSRITWVDRLHGYHLGQRGPLEQQLGGAPVAGT